MTTTPAPGQSRRTFWLATAGFALCSIAAAVRSHGFLEADGGTHYVLARHAFEYFPYLIDVWGRPVCTFLLAIGAQLGGLIGARLVSLSIAIATAAVAQAIARGQQMRQPALAAIFTFGQPLLFLHSFSELTELPFALLLGLALLAYQRRQWGWMTAITAILPLARPEGFALLPIVLIALLAHRRFWWILILPLGILFWSAVGHWVSGPPDGRWSHWLIDHWPYESGSEYPAGNLFYFFANLPMVVGPIALPAMWIGMGRGLAHVRDLIGTNQSGRVEFLLAATPLAVLIGHSLLYWRGMLSSNGELRYLLVAAPMWGVLTAQGWEWIFTTFAWQRAASWAALAAVSTGLVNFAWRIVPIQEEKSWQQAHGAVEWYLSSPTRTQYPRVLSNHPGIFYYLDIGPADPNRVEKWRQENVDHPAAGVILIWDPVFAVYNADPNQVVSLQRVMSAGWVEDWRAEWKSNVNNPPPGRDGSAASHNPRLLWHIFRSPIDAEGRQTPTVVMKMNELVWRQMPGFPTTPDAGGG
jgi:hypothetical protein